jgi:hypothetical protein
LAKASHIFKKSYFKACTGPNKEKRVSSEENMRLVDREARMKEAQEEYERSRKELRFRVAKEKEGKYC